MPAAILSMLLAMMSITAGAAMAKQIFPVIGAELTTFLRLSLAALLLAVVFRPWRQRPSLKTIKHILPYGVALGTMNMLFYLSFVRLPLGVALALEFIGPLSVALYGMRQRQDVIWVIFAIAGIGLILPITKLSAPLDPIGIILALSAGVFWALYILAGRRLAETGKETGLRSGSMVAWGMLTAALVTAPVGLASGSFTQLNGDVWLMVFGVAVLSSAVPYSLEITALKRLSAGTFGILTSLEPVIGTLSGYLFLAERLSWLQVIAICLIAIASAGSAYSESRRQRLTEVIT